MHSSTPSIHPCIRLLIHSFIHPSIHSTHVDHYNRVFTSEQPSMVDTHIGHQPFLVGRRVSQLAKLGWQKAQHVYVPLHCVHPDGGTVPCTLLVVQRKFPMMVYEKLPSGCPIARSQPTYQAAQNHYEMQAAKVIISKDPSLQARNFLAYCTERAQSTLFCTWHELIQLCLESIFMQPKVVIAHAAFICDSVDEGSVTCPTTAA